MEKVDTKSLIKYKDGGVRMKGIPQGRYTKELREVAVKLVTEGNMSLIEAARRLSLPISTMGNCVKVYRAGKPCRVGIAHQKIILSQYHQVI
ncbi:hypothetical protein EPN18_03700 [bacterium]|nr:MAG: hypothetical protein EPN18_03700 [bacterium]